MGKQNFYVMGADGKFKRLDHKYDVTISFKTKEEQEDFLRILKNLSDLKMELPGQQEGEVGAEVN